MPSCLCALPQRTKRSAVHACVRSRSHKPQAVPTNPNQETRSHIMIFISLLQVERIVEVEKVVYVDEIVEVETVEEVTTVVITEKVLNPSNLPAPRSPPYKPTL
jgi:hypothetical protein